MKKYNITVNGTTYEVIVEEVESTIAHSTPVTSAIAHTPKDAAHKAVSSNAIESISVTAPMSGTILDINVSVGQAIKKGDVICVLEAMKMENDIPSPLDGVVASINVQRGSNVNANDIIITLN